MLTYFQAALLGLLQGASELFPISSLGHLVLVPRILGWQLDLSNSQFVAFVVLTHLATALVLLGFFWRDWVNVVRGIFRSLAMREVREADVYAKVGWLLIVSTIPAGIAGLLFQERIQQLFAAAQLVAFALILNGVVLFAAERLRKRAQEGRADDAKIARLSWAQSVGIGLAQCFALIPGLSRTGLTMTGGLVSGLSHENAARFSFLLATPIIFAAAVLKVPELFGLPAAANSAQAGSPILGQAIVGALCAAVAAYLSVRFLTKYFETKTLTTFAIYCVAAGIIALFLVH